MMRHRVWRRAGVVAGCALVVGGASGAWGQEVFGGGGGSPLTYPPAHRDSVVDTMFGTAVAAPYRWMEDLNAGQVGAWITAENAVTTAYLSQLPGREAMRQRLTALWNYPKVGLPQREHGALFYTKNTGLQRQGVLYMRRTPSSV